jgi:error-prone DNA polymerase
LSQYSPVAACLDLADGTSILVHLTDPATGSWKAGAGKPRAFCTSMKIALYAQGLIGILVPDMPDAACAAKLRKLAEIFGDRAYVSL